jgi:hypothetical protein
MRHEPFILGLRDDNQTGIAHLHETPAERDIVDRRHGVPNRPLFDLSRRTCACVGDVAVVAHYVVVRVLTFVDNPIEIKQSWLSIGVPASLKYVHVVSRWGGPLQIRRSRKRLAWPFFWRYQVNARFQKRRLPLAT